MNSVTLHCQIGNHEWERPSQRGKRPLSCPDCKARAPTRALKLVPVLSDASTPVRMSAPDHITSEMVRARLKRALAEATNKYELALARGCRARSSNDIESSFDEADRHQSSIINYTRQIEKLAA